jgi:uncharacterized membrane protein
MTENTEQPRPDDAQAPQMNSGQAAEQAVEQPPTQVITSKKANNKTKRAGSALIRFIVWLVIVVVVIVVALYVSAWIAGFRNAEGWPILFDKIDAGGLRYEGMIDWIRASTGR